MWLLKKPPYKIIRANTVDELEQLVNKHLKDGWVTLGGVASGKAGRFIQAVGSRA